MKMTRVLVSTILLLSSCSGDGSSESDQGDSAETVAPLTVEEIVTTDAVDLVELAAPICADFADQYASATELPIVRKTTLAGESEGYLLMLFEEVQPFAQAADRLAELDVADPDEQADLERLITAMQEADDANALAVEDDSELVAWVTAVKRVAEIADEIGLTDCTRVTVAADADGGSDVEAVPQPANLVRLSASDDGMIRVEVLNGAFKLTNGATLRAGSSLSVPEDLLDLALGVGIEVGPGGVELQDVSYEEGTLLLVGPSDELTEVSW